MKLLFFVTGFGYGDSIRVDAIIKKILKEKPKTKIMIAGYGYSYDYFKEKFPTIQFAGYKFSDRYAKFKSIPFIAKNLMLPISWLITAIKLKKLIKTFNPDLIISDFEPVASLIAKSLNKYCLVIFGYNPKQFKRYKAKTFSLKLQARFVEMIYRRFDTVLIPTLKLDNNYENIQFIQPIIKVQPDELPSEETLMKKLKLKKKPVIVQLGGSDFGISTAKKILESIDKYQEDFIFFGGATEQIPALHYKFKENFSEYLKVSKCVITLAGQLTLSECLAFKKPMLIFPIQNHVEQILNAEALKKTAVIGDPKNVEASLDNFFKILEKKQSKLTSSQRKINGAEKAARIITKLAEAYGS